MMAEALVVSLFLKCRRSEISNRPAQMIQMPNQARVGCKTMTAVSGFETELLESHQQKSFLATGSPAGFDQNKVALLSLHAR